MCQIGVFVVGLPTRTPVVTTNNAWQGLCYFIYAST